MFTDAWLSSKQREPARYRPLTDALLAQDNYLLLADFGDYLRAQAEVDALHADPAAWNARVLRNIAAMGEFSADRTIARYLERVWAPPGH